MDRERLKFWLALTGLKGPTRHTLRTALGSVAGPRQLFEDGAFGRETITNDLKAALKKKPDWDAIEREMDRLEALGATVITLHDETYPALLTSTYDPPILLYTRGVMDVSILDSYATVAIVGTRNPSHYGLKTASRIAGELSQADVMIISGMARGCDGSAHRGALEAGGKTIAVLGTGVDVPYPRENKKLYDDILETGLVISEFPLSTPARPQNFPIRNRIISGLSLGVLVVEAPLRSGAMMTARLALESGREVFAIPGKIDSLKSVGTNKLIKDGAALVTSSKDILDGLNLSALNVKDITCNPRSTGSRINRRLEADFGENRASIVKIIGALSDEPVHIDQITINTGLNVQTASSLLLEMELKGYVEQHLGKCFLLKE